MTIATERNEARTEATYTTVREKDSVYVVDSVFVYVTQELVRETRWRTIWRERVIHDTVLEHTTDTIRETQYVDKVVEVPAKGGRAGWIVALTLMAVIVVYMVIKYGLKIL
jgi:hypothetical protein